MALGGWLTIPTKLDTKDLEKELKEEEKELQAFEKKQSELLETKAKIKVDDSEVKRLKNELDQARKKYDSLLSSASEYSPGQALTKALDQIQAIESSLKTANNEYNEQMGLLNNINAQIEENASDISITKQNISDINKEIAQQNLKDVDKNVKSIKTSVGGIGSATEGLIKKIAKWSLAIFSVRSAYQFVRQSASTLSQYNEQIGTDIEYIRFALSSTLQPLIEWMIKAVYTLLAYVKYLAKAWFDIDLFSNASAKNFNKMNKSAKDLKNQLAGFDEMNVLGDNKSGGDIKTPTMDLSKSLGEVEIPQWLKVLAEMVKPLTDWMQDIIKNEGAIGVLKSILAVLGGFIILKTIASLVTGLFAKDVSAGVSSFFTSFGKATEVIAILGGLSLVIMEITELIKTFAESGLSLQEVGILLVEVLGAITIAFTALAAATKLMDWTGIAAAAVILGGLALVLKTVTQLIETFSKSGMTLGEVGGLLAIVFGTILALMVSVAAIGPLMTAGLVPFLAVIAGISAILIVMAETLPTILDAVSKFIVAIAPVVIEYLKTMGTLINNLINTLGKVLPPIINSVGGVFKTIFDGIAKVINTVGNSLTNILNGVGSLVSSVLGSILRFIERLGPAINTFVDNAIQAVTKLINFMISGIEYLVNTLVIGGVNKIIDSINKIGTYVGITLNRVDRMSIPRFRPQLAKGGIVNMPGRGVPVGGAIAGEAGREGVIPLTDQAQMELIGEEIGKHVTINLTNVTQLDSRELSRKVQKVSADRNFAFER